jgi:protein-S-isoprenylcysteine O-methyltransferase Ste14
MKVTFRFFYFLPLFVLIIIPAILIWADPFPRLALGLWRLLGVAFMLFGSTIFVAAHRAIYKPSQWEGVSSALPGEPNQLTTSGPYRYVRHPIVTSILLILIGETLLTQSFMPILWLVFMMMIGVPILICVEEPRLEKKFGDAYRKYKKEVPRFIPKLF